MVSVIKGRKQPSRLTYNPLLSFTCGENNDKSYNLEQSQGSSILVSLICEIFLTNISLLVVDVYLLLGFYWFFFPLFGGLC